MNAYFAEVIILILVMFSIYTLLYLPLIELFNRYNRGEFF